MGGDRQCYGNKGEQMTRHNHPTTTPKVQGCPNMPNQGESAGNRNDAPKCPHIEPFEHVSTHGCIPKGSFDNIEFNAP